ncbi:hypothetical protein QVD17_14550 [Tagetes erecta]|uniref:F-box domain-containing protein n=1 Tax=Tagetes erecta TaxID=13708 RepID=A0AAD8P423_TARER|nr:hypothetical protein QVD17_14550 [Tagetes erecta]
MVILTSKMMIDDCVMDGLALKLELSNIVAGVASLIENGVRPKGLYHWKKGRGGVGSYKQILRWSRARVASVVVNCFHFISFSCNENHHTVSADNHRTIVSVDAIDPSIKKGLFQFSTSYQSNKKKPEMKAKRLSKPQRLNSDIITTLPQTIIETILCLLPIEEAARTSILSREWRHKWTKIPKLEFSFTYTSRRMDLREILRALHQIMLLRQDPIHEFTLSMDTYANNLEIDHKSKHAIDEIILDLSRNHMVKKFKLLFGESNNRLYSLPLSIFSLHRLVELDLSWCDLDHQSIFTGFGRLTSLTFECVRMSTKTLLQLLSNCPSLKSFGLLMLAESVTGKEKSTMTELFECLPMIDQLTIWSDVIPWFVPDLVPQELQTPLIHLKYFRCELMSFHDGYALTFLAVLIKNSPNLEKLKLEIETNSFYTEIDYYPDLYEEYHSDVWLEHISDVWLENLIELKIKYFSNLEPELAFVKFILARSPKLKKVSIICDFGMDKESWMLKNLLRTPRVSAVEIHVF